MPSAWEICTKLNKNLFSGLFEGIELTVGSNGKPGSWVEVPATGTRSITVFGLTPGANYAFQMRALGRAGYTDWSDSVTRISL